jgi:hypothetical protein
MKILQERGALPDQARPQAGPTKTSPHLVAAIEAQVNFDLSAKPGNRFSRRGLLAPPFDPAPATG